MGKNVRLPSRTGPHSYAMQVDTLVEGKLAEVLEIMPDELELLPGGQEDTGIVT